MLSLAFFSILVLVFAWIGKWIYYWNYPSCNGKLPPGSMGLPFFGETVEFLFLKPQTTFDVPPFVKDRIRRYGSLFKTNLIGQQVIISTDPGFCRFLFLQDGISLEYGSLSPAFTKIIGKNIWATSTVPLRRYLERKLKDHLHPPKQKDFSIVSHMEQIVLRYLDTWSKQESVEFKQVTTSMSFEIALERLLDRDALKMSESLRDKYASMLKGIFSFPFDIPGFHFHKCLKDKRQVQEIIKEAVKERLFSTEKHADFLNSVIEDMKKEAPVFDIDSASHFIMTTLFAAFISTSLAIVLAIKFISEHPSVLKDLEDEHETILRNKSDLNAPLTWKDYTSMTFTSHVIDETLRLTNIAPMVAKRASKDIHTDDGYIIPAGWLILICPPAIHLNPETYPDPLAFNPWRWKGKGSNIASKDFGVFGGGFRQCPGAEFVKLEMAVVLHFLVTKYRFTKIKGGEIAWIPNITLPNGLHLKITKKL